MHPLKTLLNERDYHNTIGRFPEWEKMEFVNHEMGCIRVEEHKYMIDNGLISCDGKLDAIIADYPKLMITKSNGEETSIDMGGNLRDIKFEMEKQRKEGKSAHIEFFPRRYVEYQQKKYGENKYREENKVALDSLAKSFGGEVIPDF